MATTHGPALPTFIDDTCNTVMLVEQNSLHQGIGHRMTRASLIYLAMLPAATKKLTVLNSSVF